LRGLENQFQSPVNVVIFQQNLPPFAVIPAVNLIVLIRVNFEQTDRAAQFNPPFLSELKATDPQEIFPPPVSTPKTQIFIGLLHRFTELLGQPFKSQLGTNRQGQIINRPKPEFVGLNLFELFNFLKLDFFRQQRRNPPANPNGPNANRLLFIKANRIFRDNRDQMMRSMGFNIHQRIAGC